MEKVICGAPGLASPHMPCAFFEATLGFDQELERNVTENCFIENSFMSCYN